MALQLTISYVGYYCKLCPFIVALLKQDEYA